MVPFTADRSGIAIRGNRGEEGNVLTTFEEAGRVNVGTANLAIAPASLAAEP